MDKIGFKGSLLIEPKPHEPTKHQYDFDSASVFAFLQVETRKYSKTLDIALLHFYMGIKSSICLLFNNIKATEIMNE